MNEIILQIFGQERSFTKQKLEAMVEKYLIMQKSILAADEWFTINPREINQQDFSTKREDDQEEATRQLIIEAFEQMKVYPQKYARPFQTMRLIKDIIKEITIKEKMLIVDYLGSNMMDWVFLGLEWAQRIANGETWKSLCEILKPSEYITIVIWKDNKPHLIGANASSGQLLFKTTVDLASVNLEQKNRSAVPGIMRYSK